MLFKARLQAFQNLERVFHVGLNHINLLETTGQSTIFLENTAVFLERGRTDALDIARGQHGLQQVRGIHHTAGSGTRTDDGVDFINKQNGVGLFLQL